MKNLVSHYFLLYRAAALCVLAFALCGGGCGPTPQDADDAVEWMFAELMRVERGWTPSDDEIIAGLQASGLADGYSSKHDLTVIAAASANGRDVVVRWLLAQGVSPNPRRGASPLILALRGGTRETVGLLLEAGADPNAVRKGDTPLDAAAQSAKGWAIPLLFKHGAVPREQEASEKRVGSPQR